MTSATEELERMAELCSRLRWSWDASESPSVVLELVATVLGAQTAAFRALSPGESRPVRLASLGIKSAVDDAYLDRYHALDPGRRLLGQQLRAPAFANPRRGGEWLGETLPPAAEPFRADFRRYRREFLLPNGFHHNLGFGVQAAQGRMLLFNFHRGVAAPAFGSLERARARVVALYLQAQAVGDRLAVDAPSAAVRLPLSARERDVAAAVAVGLSNKEIAAKLGISVRTVENHLRSMFAKLDVGTRTRLVAKLRGAARPPHDRLGFDS